MLTDKEEEEQKKKLNCCLSSAAFYWRSAQPGIPKISEATAAQVFKGDIGMQAAKKEPPGLMQVLGLEVINHP